MCAGDGAERAQGAPQPGQIMPWWADDSWRFGFADVPGEIFT